MTDLRKLAALRREATPGPLTLIRYDLGGGRLHVERGLVADFYNEQDREFYAAAGSLSAEELDALADVVEERDRLLAWVEKRKARDKVSRDRYRAAHPEAHRKSARESMARHRAALDRLQETTR